MSAYPANMSNRNLDMTHDDDEEEESQLREFFKFLHEYFEVEQKWGEIQRFSSVHPIVSLFLIVTIAMCSIPVVIFSMFVVGSITVSILGFVFFEGTALAIGTIVFGGTLFFVVLFAVGFSAFLVCGYYAVQMSGSFLQNVKEKLPPIPYLTYDSEPEMKKKW